MHHFRGLIKTTPMNLFGFKISREAVNTPVQGGAGTPIAAANYHENVVSVNSPSKALKVAAVYRAVNLISNGIGILPMHFKRWNAPRGIYVTDYTTIAGNRINYLLSVKPNSRMTAYQFWKNTVSQILLGGNAFIVPRFNIYGEPEEFILCTPGTVIYDVFTNKYTVFDEFNGINESLYADQIIHLKNISLDGYFGMSTIAFAANVLGIAATGDQETLKRFATGGRFKGLISNNSTVQGFGKYQDKELEKSANTLQEKLYIQDITALQGDVKYTPMSMSSADMQFLDSRKFTIREIARFFNVPATKLMDDSNTVYGTAEANNLAFYGEALQPIIADIEEEFRAKLVGLTQYQNYKYVFDLSSLFALDRKSQAEWNKSRLETGVASVNDLRREMDTPPVDKGGDDVYVTANIVPLGSDKLWGTTKKPE